MVGDHPDMNFFISVKQKHLYTVPKLQESREAFLESLVKNEIRKILESEKIRFAYFQYMILL
jgi:hypothetical protein